MAKKLKKKKVADPKCQICTANMILKKIIPAAHVFAELKTFQCNECGLLRTVENVAELTVPEARAKALQPERLF